MKNWIDNTCARIIDQHTVMLGNGNSWIRVELPWLARDIVHLVKCACSDEKIDVKERERVAAIRIVLSKLHNENEKIVNAPIEVSPSAIINSKEYFRTATVIRSNSAIPFDGPIILICTPNQLLTLESFLENRSLEAITSVVVLSGDAVIIGPILKTRDLCLLCFRYMAAQTFNIHEKDSPDNEYMLNAGLAIARVLERRIEDVITISNGSVKFIPHAPFIGCPKCFPCQ